MKSHNFWKTASFLAVALMLANSVAASDSSNRPNILLILADDLGWPDLACYGNEFNETPNLDRLAKGGMLFNDAYAASTVCSPTRASILSGKYPARTGVTDWIPGRVYPEKPLECPTPKSGMDLEEFTIAEALKDVGYATASIGKWHVGHHPVDQGFDVELVATGPFYFSPYHSRSLPDGPDGEYRTDRLTSEAISVIKKWEEGQKPWFMYLPYCSIHAPIKAKPETIKKYVEKGAGENRSRNKCTFAAALDHLDENVGRLMDHLEASGQAEMILVRIMIWRKRCRRRWSNFTRSFWPGRKASAPRCPSPSTIRMPIPASPRRAGIERASGPVRPGATGTRVRRHVSLLKTAPSYI